MKIPKQIYVNLRIFFAIWALFLIGLMVLFTMYTLNIIKNETKLNEALIDNVGKPIIYEQHYFSPMK